MTQIITDFEKGLLYGWSNSAEMPIEVRHIIKKICNPMGQFELTHKGNDLDEFLARCNFPAHVLNSLVRLRNEYRCSTLDDLLSIKDCNMLKIPALGRGTLNIILAAYNRFGLTARRANILNNKQGK